MWNTLKNRNQLLRNRKTRLPVYKLHTYSRDQNNVLNFLSHSFLKQTEIHENSTMLTLCLASILAVRHGFWQARSSEEVSTKWSCCELLQKIGKKKNTGKAKYSFPSYLGKTCLATFYQSINGTGCFASHVLNQNDLSLEQNNYSWHFWDSVKTSFVFFSYELMSLPVCIQCLNHECYEEYMLNPKCKWSAFMVMKMFLEWIEFTKGTH